MAIGDRIRIISDQEFRIMSPPRTPRGEKPATTIRLLRRQLTQMEQTIGALRRDIGDKEKVIAGYDVQLEEANDEASELRATRGAQAMQLGEAYETIRCNAERLAFLKGYYAAHQEARETVSIPRASLAGDPPQTHAARGAGNPRDLSAGRPRGEEARQD